MKLTVMPGRNHSLKWAKIYDYNWIRFISINSLKAQQIKEIAALLNITAEL